jgi:hypothetical protein
VFVFLLQAIQPLAHVYHIEAHRSDISSLARVFAEKNSKTGVSVQSDAKVVSAFLSKFYRSPVICGLVDLEPASRKLSFYHDLLNAKALHDWGVRCPLSEPPLGLKTILRRWTGMELYKSKCIQVLLISLKQSV